MGLLSMLGRRAGKVARAPMAAGPVADDVMAPNIGFSGSFGTGRERQAYDLLHDMPGASEEEIAARLGVTPEILRIYMARLQQGGFDTINRGRPEMGGPMSRGEY